eukprot:Gregarina_sp_Poly_1__5755@NODE_3027_length_1442_cov_8_708364_g1916_i0_p1_GENE_NODE_3027_length_1442_cov_8_708364_g1916_i0NODE_3027_length_1442_cov_8_708364_g1916_i0_p1_ORF_typecomplete_len132_score14_43TMEM144/PF07857_12/0_092_NODE_3027_length_1442_cov_8_708364_g1916_i0302697
MVLLAKTLKTVLTWKYSDWGKWWISELAFIRIRSLSKTSYNINIFYNLFLIRLLHMSLQAGEKHRQGQVSNRKTACENDKNETTVQITHNKIMQQLKGVFAAQVNSSVCGSTIHPARLSSPEPLRNSAQLG